LSSVIETTSVDDFLSNAEAARKNFEAEKGLFVCLFCLLCYVHGNDYQFRQESVQDKIIF
jgi:hypothetical protein